MTPVTQRAARIAAAAIITVGTLTACSTTSDQSGAGSDASATPTTSVSTETTSATPSSTGSPAASTAQPSASASANPGDIMFAQMMIPHHQQAIEMADMALAKSDASAKVKQLATDIKKAQDPEIATMRGWLTSWGAAPSASPSGMHDGHGMGHGGGMMSAAEMEELQAAKGSEFDRLWLTMMIRHHEGAVTMSEQVLQTTQQPEVRTLAQDIITAQKAAIATMRDLL